MSNVLLISADCHAGAQPETYREYLPAKYREPFDAWWTELDAEMAARRGTFFDQDSVDEREKSASVLAGGFLWKAIVITRACHQQGFALAKFPQRGSGKLAAPVAG